MLTDDEVKAIRERRAKNRPGAWECGADFSAHAPTDIDALLADREEIFTLTRWLIDNIDSDRALQLAGKVRGLHPQGWVSTQRLRAMLDGKAVDVKENDARACTHASMEPGPRVTARYGSWATKVCVQCGAYQEITSGGPAAWKPGPVQQESEDGE